MQRIFNLTAEMSVNTLHEATDCTITYDFGKNVGLLKTQELNNI